MSRRCEAHMAVRFGLAHVKSAEGDGRERDSDGSISEPDVNDNNTGKKCIQC